MDKVSDKILTKAEVMWHRRVVQTNSFFPNLNQNQDHVRKKSSKLNQNHFFQIKTKLMPEKSRPNQIKIIFFFPNQNHAEKKTPKSNQIIFPKSKSRRKKVVQIKSRKSQSNLFFYGF